MEKTPDPATLARILAAAALQLSVSSHEALLGSLTGDSDEGAEKQLCAVHKLVRDLPAAAQQAAARRWWQAQAQL